MRIDRFGQSIVSTNYLVGVVVIVSAGLLSLRNTPSICSDMPAQGTLADLTPPQWVTPVRPSTWLLPWDQKRKSPPAEATSVLTSTADIA